MDETIDGWGKAWRVEKLGPYVADGLSGLADLEAGLRQGFSFADLPIFVEPYCSNPRLNIRDKTYTLGTSRVIVRMVLGNCEIVSRYQGLTIQTGSVTVHTQTQAGTSAESQQDRGFNLAGQVDGRGGKISFGAVFGSKKSRKDSHSATDKRDLNPEIKIISTNGVSGFAYGDFHFGDPRRPKGLLYDVYKCTDGGEKAEELPLVTVAPKNGKEPMSVDFFVYVPTDRLWVSSDARANPNSSTIAAARSSVEARVEALRAQMMEREYGERVASHQRSRDWPAKDGEFIVYATKLVVHPPQDADEH